MASAGKILLMPKGEYDSGTAYSVLDWVRYGGKAWVCKQNSTGNTPAENAYWAELCADGIDGENGESYYMYVRYSENSDGTDFVSTPTESTIYIGFYTGNSNTAPADKTAYTWSRYVGSGGGGTGAWVDITGKPFSSVGSDGLKVASGILDVDLTKVQSILSDATTSVSGKMSAEDKEKLDGIADNANNYSLPTASDSVKGGVKITGTDGLTMDSDTLKANVKGLINNKTDFDAQTVSTSQAVDSLLVKELLDDMSGIALTGTLAIGATSITFTDAMIVTGNTIKCDYYTDVYGVSPSDVTITAGSMTLTFTAQTVAVGVRVEIREV